jgi:uncharacterized membrane protein
VPQRRSCRHRTSRSVWATQASTIFTILSFLNVTKQPPSLLFLLITLGAALLMLRALDQRTPRVLQPALVFGRVPLVRSDETAPAGLVVELFVTRPT